MRSGVVVASGRSGNVHRSGCVVSGLHNRETKDTHSHYTTLVRLTHRHNHATRHREQLAMLRCPSGLRNK